MKNIKCSIKYMILILFIFPMLLHGNENKTINSFNSKNCFMLPQSRDNGEIQQLFYFSLAKLPEDLLEEASELMKAPLFSYKLIYGLPSNFELNTGLSTNIVTFHVHIGAKWNHQIDNLSFSLGYDIAYYTGKLAQFGFDSGIKGWINYPNLSLGYKFDKFAIIVTSELIITTAMSQTQDDIKIGSSRNEFAGYGFGVYVDQPLFGETHMTLGIKSLYTKFYYPAWAMFSTFDRRFFIPEVFVGITL
jgi:hypothetical protein